MPRPSQGETHRVYLTLTKPLHESLEAFAAQMARPSATVAAQILSEVLARSGKDGAPIDRQDVAAVIRALRGERTFEPEGEPRWTWPMDALLAEAGWWGRWYPELCRLLGRRLEDSSARLGERQQVIDQHGYADVLEFLCPTLAARSGGTTTWRSVLWPAVAEARRKNEAAQPLAPLWEAAVRHVALALSLLEDATIGEKGSASALVLVQSQIRHDWLSTLLSLVGEAEPPGSPRLPTQRLL